MARIFPPRSVKPLAHLLMLIYGPEGCGKTLLALKCAHRLVAPVGGTIVAIDADEGRINFYSEYQFRPEPFREVFSARTLIEKIDEYTEMAREAPGTITMIIDSVTPFWERKGGIKEINDTVNVEPFKGNTWSAWSITGPQEVDPLYMAMRRFTQFGHMIICAEQGPDYEKNKIVGVKPKFRDGFGHRMDFVLRAERYFSQEVTARDEKPEDAATSSHRVIIEKVTIARSKPQPDGTVLSEYPVKTGTVVPDADGGVAARFLEYLNEGAGNYQEVIDEYLEDIKDADRDGMLKAYNYAQHVAWPDEHREKLKDSIIALGSKFQAPQAAETADPQAAETANMVGAVVDAVHTAAGAVEAALGLREQYSWSYLTVNHPVEEWEKVAADLDSHCKSEIELDHFLALATHHERWGNVHELIENRKAELAHDRP